ncbi:MAG: N-acetylglucosamine-6-phosphate deacetylase [Chitinophagaceae bacterium]|nr:MAG: N-acetylglucosamine-6-phosphate deacetylase [Chitinophagaceae bacterium]
MSSIIKIFNGKIITPFRIIPQGTVIIQDGKIAEVTEGNIEVRDAVEIDARGKYISPGFIDIHVHGGGGYDFMDGTVEAFLKVAELHAKYGTTSMLPTTLTSEVEELYVTLDNYKKAKEQNKSGAQFLGIHLEGPYFSVNQRGAQDPRYIRNPNPKEYKDILAHSSDIRRWSAAPELPGAIEFAHYMKSKGILVALGHTDALFEEALKGFENGFTLATHFYSCMSGVTRKNALRYAGVIECGYLIDEMDVEVIADGIHCPPPLLKLIYKIKGTDHTALITDSMRAAGMPEGESILGSLHNGLKVIVEDGVAKLPDRTSFAGSVATTDRLVRTMVKMADIPLPAAVRMATATPARILEIEDKKGSLIKGKDADVLIFDDDIQIQTTIINGRIIYNKN